jgi:hypothetical protein
VLVDGVGGFCRRLAQMTPTGGSAVKFCGLFFPGGGLLTAIFSAFRDNDEPQ